MENNHHLKAGDIAELFEVVITTGHSPIIIGQLRACPLLGISVKSEASTEAQEIEVALERIGFSSRAGIPALL